MRYGLLLAVVLVGGIAFMARTATAQSNLQNYGEAPELLNNVFLNTETPLRLADLRGQVVLIEFWTFDCINCIRTLPYVQSWHETYADQGLVVIGNHYPEFRYERDIANVEAALGRLGVTYPVAQDNARLTWGAYNNRYWPTIYIIDKAGDLRYRHIGEGRYNETEATIQTLLAEPYTPEIMDEPETTAATVIEPRQFIIPREPLNVRNGPGTQYERVGTLSTNVVLIVLGEESGWYEIEWDGSPGYYISGEYVTVGEW